MDRDKIVIAGESAGGGLAAALAMLVRDRGEIPLAGQILLYPMLDDRTATSIEPDGFAGEFIWTPAMNRFSWTAYLPCEPGSAETPPYASAARSEDFSGLPPTHIFAGALDLFLRENLSFARKLACAGVPIEVSIYSGAFHAFDLAGDTRIGRRFAREFDAAFLRLVNVNYVI